MTSTGSGWLSSWGQIVAHHTGQDIEKIRHDTERDYWMTAEEAKQYGLIDTVLSGREPSAVAGAGSAS